MPIARTARRRGRASARWASYRAARRADHRRCLDMDGDDAVQSQPTRARRPRRRRRVGGGGLALGFNTIAVSDNQSQGTPGMRASLISREVIADSIELMVHAHDFDGLVCVVGCDKTVPAALMALARVDKPALLLYSGPMRAGGWRGREVTIQDVWEAVGAEERGLIVARGSRRAGAVRLPRRGHVRRSFHGEHDGRRGRLPGNRLRRGHARARGRARAERRRRGPRRASPSGSSSKA